MLTLGVIDALAIHAGCDGSRGSAHRTSLALLFASQQILDLPSERRKLFLNYVPEDCPVDAEILMNEPVPEAGNLAPGDVAVLLPELGRDVPDGLTDDLKVANDGVLLLGVREEFGEGYGADVTLNSVVASRMSFSDGTIPRLDILDAVPDASCDFLHPDAVHTVRCQDLDPLFEELFEKDAQSVEVVVRGLVELDEKINVAASSLLIARVRSEQANAPDGEPFQVFVMLAQGPQDACPR